MFRLMTIAGIPVSADLTLLLMLGLSASGMAQNGWPFAAMFVLVFVSAILVHEMGHALALRHYKRRPYIVIHGFGGLTGPVEDLEIREEAIVTAMGPIAGLLFGGALYGAFHWLASNNPQFLLENPLIHYGLGSAARFNLFLSVLNLAPVFPLDGGQLLRLGLTRWGKNRARATRILHGVGVVGAGLLAWWSFTSGASIFGFMMIMAAMANLRGLSGESAGAPTRSHNQYADELLRAGNDALGRGNAPEAARLAHQVKAMSNLSKGQTAEMWSLLGLATTEIGEWDDALAYLKRAPRSAAVEAAEARCKTAMERQQKRESA